MESLSKLKGVTPRVHAAAFGFSEPAHVCQPLLVMRADAFFLLENENDRALEKHSERGVDLHSELDKTGVDWERIQVDLWNPAGVGAALRQIILDYSLGELLVNASVGPNTVAVGATLASLFAPIRLYHPAGPDPSSPLTTMNDVAFLPTVKASGWKAQHVQILRALENLGGAASGTDLKQKLRGEDPGVIGTGRGGGEWAQREHARFQALAEFLKEAGAISVDKSRRRWHVELTESGSQMATLLAGLESK